MSVISLNWQYPLLTSSNASIVTSGLYVFLSQANLSDTLRSIYYYNLDDTVFKNIYATSKNSVRINYVDKSLFPAYTTVATDLLKTNIDLPFIFPMLLNDLTNLGIGMSAMHNWISSDDINFYKKDYNNTILLFKELNPDAYNVFANTTVTDANKMKVDLINYNMQYCIVTSEILNDYLKSQSNWISYSNFAVPVVTWQIPKNIDVTYKTTNKQSVKGSRYSTSELYPISLDGNDAFVYKSFTNVVNPNLFLFRKAVAKVNRALNLEFSAETITMNPQNLAFSAYNNGIDDYLYVSYVAKMDFNKPTKGVIVNDFGTYPMLSGNIINYVTQSITTKYASTADGFNDINNSTNNCKLNYSVPMIAKYKFNYTDATKKEVKLSLVDSAALNQFVINHPTNSGIMPGFGNLRDKQFVRAPFIVNNTISSLDQKSTVNGISLIHQTHILDSVIDVANNSLLCVCFSSKINQNLPSDIQYDSPYRENIVGGSLILNVYNLNSLSKIAPETHVLKANINLVSALRIIKHNNDYYVAISYNTVGGGSFNSYVYKLIYNLGSVAAFTEITKIDNCTKISIQGVQNGVME